MAERWHVKVRRPAHASVEAYSTSADTRIGALQLAMGWLLSRKEVGDEDIKIDLTCDWINE